MERGQQGEQSFFCLSKFLKFAFILLQVKKNYNLPHPIMANTDLTRLLKSEEIKRVLRAPKKAVHRAVRRLNPLTNSKQMVKLNPYAEVTRRRALLAKEKKKYADQITKATKAKKVLPKGHPALAYQKSLLNRKTQLKKVRTARLVRSAAKQKVVAAKRAAKIAKAKK